MSDVDTHAMPEPHADRNKSELTHKITRDAVQWLDDRGFKPVETEVCVARGWVADIAGVGSLTTTEAVNLKLIQGKRWGGDYAEMRKTQRDVFLALPSPMTAVIEVKTSRADFLGDRKWALPAPANICLLAVPSGMLDADEFPPGWWVLSYNETAPMRTVYRAGIHPQTIERQMQIVLEIAVRRDHHTRYARFREASRQARVWHNEEVSRTRLSTTIGAVESIVKGEHESVEGAMSWHGLRKVPEYLRRRLEKLWRVGAEVSQPIPPEPV